MWGRVEQHAAVEAVITFSTEHPYPWRVGNDIANVDVAGNLRLYMTELCRKLEPDPSRPRWLVTEPGLGYRFQPDP